MLFKTIQNYLQGQSIETKQKTTEGTIERTTEKTTEKKTRNYLELKY